MSAWSGTSPVTTAPAATIACFPIVCPQTIVAFAPLTITVVGVGIWIRRRRL